MKVVYDHRTGQLPRAERKSRNRSKQYTRFRLTHQEKRLGISKAAKARAFFEQSS